jgi:hypothetical protein
VLIVTTEAGEPHASAPAVPLTRDELWRVYKLAVEECNFEVTLNWDRTKHYFVFNAAVFSAAGGLSHLENGRYTTAAAAAFFLASLNAFFAAYSIWKGHTYYRAARRHLKLMQHRLMGDEFALKTTRGMARATDAKPPLKDRFTITNLAITLQLYIAFAAAYGFVQVLQRPP